MLEKAVGKRLQHDIVKHELVPTTQFGGRSHSSCTDAGLALIHDVQSAFRAGLKCGVLLFDVRGFFDNVNHPRLVRLMSDLGFDANIVGWASNFLEGRKVRLRFNNVVSDERGKRGSRRDHPSRQSSLSYTPPHYCTA